MVLTPLARESTRLCGSPDFEAESTREIGLSERVQEKPASGKRLLEKSDVAFSAATFSRILGVRSALDGPGRLGGRQYMTFCVQAREYWTFCA